MKNQFIKIPNKNALTIKAENEAKKECDYQKELKKFLFKNPNADEEFYIEYRIKVIEKGLIEFEKTANFIKGQVSVSLLPTH